jgi:hypothetical protein
MAQVRGAERMNDQSLITCRALGCHNRRARRGATHCGAHEVEWHAIQHDQHALKSRGRPIHPEELAALKARRFAMGMSWPPRSYQ